MRQLEYLSPTQLKLYREARDEYYLRYLADTKPPRFAQTQPMSIGSAFDAYVKSHVHTQLFGVGRNKGSEYEFNTIFEKQVEPQHRIWGREHGAYVFKMYQSTGALADLFVQLKQAIGEPRFEFELRGEVRGVDKTIDGVVFMGKPDIYFTNHENNGIIFDWKVNGYCSNWPTSPKPGYIRIMPGWSMHKDCDRKSHKGLIINSATTLDVVEAEWAAQLSIYSWLCGEEVGAQFVTAIDQVVCNTKGLSLAWPELRFAQHRLTVKESFQSELFYVAKELWDSVKNNHYFFDLSKEESDGRCALLDGKAKSMWAVAETEEDKMFQEMTEIPRLF